MKRVLLCALMGAVAWASGCQKEPGGTKQAGQTSTAGKGDPKTARRAGPRQLWSAGGFQVPESVLYSAADKVLFVSNINGKPTEKNGKGFISKLSLDGKLISLQWATGFDAPKGMGLWGDTLYVTDVTRLHAVDTRTGKIKHTVSVPEAKFLNDIAIGPQGEVYVSDMLRGTVHKLQGGTLPVLADLKQRKGSNGMLMQGEALLVGTATGIVKVDPKTGAAELLVPVQGFGMIDGLKPLGPDAYIVSNWKGKTQIVTRAGQVTVLLDTSAKNIQSADLEYISEQKLLLIPTFFDNRVVAYRLR
ncbi:MAG: ATP-binding protein [bacterium]